MTFDQDKEKVRSCAEKLVLAARSDPAQAKRFVEEIESVASANPQPIFEAYSQRGRGHLLQAQGDMIEAVRRYRIAHSLFDQCHEQVEKARTASTLVGALVPLGEFEEALRLAAEARQAFQEANLQNRAARLDVNVGNLYHRLNRLEDALDHYERAAEFLEHSDDCEAAAGVLINRSVVLMLLYRFDEARKGFLRARDFSEKHGLRVFATQSEYNRAYLLYLAGEYAQALKLMQIAEAGFQALGDTIHVSHCRLDRAEILAELNLPEHALELANLAEKGFFSSGLKGERARALLLLGHCLMRLGQTGKARIHYSDARTLFQANGNAIWAAMAEVGIASTLMAVGQWQESADLAVQAAEFLRSQKQFPFAIVADTLGARALIKLGDPAGALQLLADAEKPLKSQLPSSVRYHIQYLRGRALELQGDVEGARNGFREAMASLEFLLTHISVDRAMVRFLEDKEDVYERLAGLTEDIAVSFALVDRARTRALTSFSDSRDHTNEPSERVRQLRDRLRSDYQGLFRAGETQPLVLFDKIQRGERQLQQELLETGFRDAAPSARPFGADSLELSPDEVLLEYFVQDETVSVFVARRASIERVVLPISRAELEEETQLCRYGLASAGNPRRGSAFRFHLQRLYEALFEPVLPLLRRRIIIVPHRFLHDFPFHILLGPEGYVAERYVMSYAPSSAAYASASRSEPTSSGNSLIIGTDDPDLPAIRREVCAVADQLPNCRIAVNKSFQEIRSGLETASFIHFVSHSFFRSDDPGWSLLNLGSDVLVPADLMDLKINADLVTMSACSTGRTLSRSNEVPGFVRAFSLWGVPSLIASLWEVDDGATSLLMSSLYEGLRDSPDLGGHLRRAMLKVKEQYAHPVHWGGFILIGKQTLGRNWNKFASRDARKLENGTLS